MLKNNSDNWRKPVGVERFRAVENTEVAENTLAQSVTNARETGIWYVDGTRQKSCRSANILFVAFVVTCMVVMQVVLSVAMGLDLADCVLAAASMAFLSGGIGCLFLMSMRGVE